MRNFFLVGIGAALLMLALNARAVQARVGGLSRITLDVPVKPGRQLGRAIDNVLVILKDRRFSYLDLTIQFPLNGPAPFALTRDGQPLARQGKGCRPGPLPLGGGRIYHLAPINNNRQLLFSVITGEAAQFPYLDVACEYINPQVVSMRVRGFFHIVCNRGAESLNVQLRPFNPPVAQARQILTVPVRRVSGQIAKLAAKNRVGGRPVRQAPGSKAAKGSLKPPASQRRQRASESKKTGNRTASRTSRLMKCL